MAFPDDRYYYDWTDDFGVNYRLYFSVGDDTYDAFGDTTSTTFTDVVMPKDWISKVEFKAGWGDKINIGIEEPKTLEITWDLNNLDSNIETVLYDGSNVTTAFDQSFTLHNGRSKYETANTEAYDNFQKVDFFYENLVRVYEWNSTEANSTLLFEGVQDINLDNDLRDNELDTTFICIGAKALEAIRPYFRTLNLAYTDGSSSDWSQNEQELAFLFIQRRETGSVDEVNQSTIAGYRGKGWNSDAPSFISWTFGDLLDRIELFAGYLIKAWRRGNTTNFILSGTPFRGLTFYKQQSATNTLGSLSQYGTYDIDVAGEEISTNTDLRFIGLTTSGIGTYNYDGGLLFDNGDFDKTKTCWNLIDELLDGFLAKMVFTYTSTTIIGRFLYLDSGDQTKLTLPDQNNYVVDSEKYNFGRISYATAEAPNIETTEKVGSGSAGSLEIIYKGSGNKNFDSNDLQLLMHNSHSYMSGTLQGKELNSEFYFFYPCSNGWQNGLFTTVSFGDSDATRDEAILLIHDKCKVTKDGSTEVETENTEDYLAGGDTFSDYHQKLKQIVAYQNSTSRADFLNSNSPRNFKDRSKEGFIPDSQGVVTSEGAFLGEWERLRNQVSGLAYLVAKASVQWYGVRRHYLKIKLPTNLINVTQLGSQVSFTTLSNITYYSQSTGDYVLIGYESDLKGYCMIELLEVK